MILINGFPRSGTTYLYRYLLWRFKERVLFEPVYAPYASASKESVWKEAFRYHPLFTFSSTSSNPLWFLYNEELLRKYLSFFKDYHMKEVTLHFFVDRPFIRENWEVFHIIRDPVSTYYSFKRLFIDQTIYPKLFSFMRKLKLNFLENAFKRSYVPLFKMAYILLWDRLDPFKIKIKEFEEAFLIVWTLSNYYAVNALDENHVIVYNKEEEYEKLKDFDEFKKVEPLNIKVYNDNSLMTKFERIAKDYKIDEEFYSLMNLFK